MIFGWFFNTVETQSPVFTGPYFSAAANQILGRPIRVDLDEVRSFKKLQPDEREAYRFKKSAAAVAYSERYAIGFVYLIMAAKSLFPWMSDQMALEALQILVHAIVSTIIIVCLRTITARALFFFAYAINPLIIYFVTYPYYYFWQIIPSFCFVCLLLRKDNIESVSRFVLLIFAVLLGIVVVARPSVLPITICLLLYAILRLKPKRWVLVGSAVTVLTAIMLFAPTHRNPWHTIYIGVGGYSNPFGITELSDNVGYNLFAAKTGTTLNVSIGGNYYSGKTQNIYGEITKEETLNQIKEQPWLYIRNAILNILQSYSIGYINGAPGWAHYLISLSGIFTILCMIYSKQYFLLLAIGISGIAFTLFYPPIQAYMYGSFLLLVVAGIRFLEYVGFLSRGDQLLKNKLPHAGPIASREIVPTSGPGM